MFHERKLIKADGSMRQICCHMMMSLVRTTFRQKRRQKVEWARLIQRGRGETMQREEEEEPALSTSRSLKVVLASCEHSSSAFDVRFKCV